MKPYQLIVASVLFFALWTSCTSPTNEQNTQQSLAPKDNKTQADAAIELNNGEKWKVNEEMTPFVNNIEKAVTAFESTPKKDYKALATELQSNLDQLVASCTMQGKSHEELHKWLLPLMASVKTMSETDNQDEAVKAYMSIQQSVKTYKRSFQ